MNRPISIGVSACLLGHRVRHDGDHRLQPTIKDDLEELFQLQPICPEVESGMGVPRTPIQLVETRYGVRALEIQDPGKDYTQKLGQVAKDWV
ncbi:MAG: DUF523 domain-containing protein, partial [Gammaproteobacteria bacterium]|nr:DUF523 domain-containing protein [Gammaproteobacteria bacterium]